MAEANHIIGLDAGTTGIRAVLFDDRLVQRRRAYAEIEQFFPRPGWVEHDAAEIRDTSVRLMRELVDDDFSEVAAIGITNQRETVVAFDGTTGEPLRRAIVWQCRRTADMCRELRETGAGEVIRERTGLLLDPYFSGTKMRWMLEHDEAVRAAADSGNLCMGTIDAWLVHCLTGGEAFTTDPTNASRTLLFDLEKWGWSRELIDLLGVGSVRLPDIVPSVGDFGTTSAAVLGAGIPIRGILGDQQAALFGQGCFEPGQVKSTYGTGAFVLMHTGETRVAPKGGLLATAAAGRRGERAYALEGAIFVAGAALQWLRDELGILGDAAESAALAASLDGNDGVYLVPAFAGLGAPWWDPGARGVICGLTRGSGRAHFARAALESIAYQTRDLLGEFESDSGHAVSELRVDGGAARNDWLMQFQADVAGVPVARAADLESTAKGAAAAAAVGVGLIDDPESAAGIGGSATRFVPGMDDAAREELLRGWADAVARARSTRE